MAEMSEGVSKVETKAPVVKRVKELLTTRLTKEQKRIVGQDVEHKWMAAYERIYNALDENIVKKAFKTMLPVIKVEAKLARVSTSVVDTVGGFLLRYPGFIRFAVGTLRIGQGLAMRGESSRRYNTTRRQLLGQSALLAGRGAAENIVGKSMMRNKLVSRSTIAMTEVGATMGERVAHVVNRILNRGKPV